MKKISKVLWVLLGPALAWLFPVVFLYSQNAKEVAVVEILEPAAIFMLGMVISFLLGKLIFRELNCAAFFSSVSGLLLTNFDMILKVVQKLSLEMRYWHVLYLMIVLCIAVCYIAKRFSLAADGLFIVKIVFGGLIVFNLITAAPTIIQRISDTQAANTQSTQEENHKKGKRNIYFLLCDEYAGFAQMEEEFGFDNAEFREALQNLKFNISNTSRNDSDHTTVVMANFMQLDYVATEDSTSVELENLTTNGRLHELLLENGYQLRGIGDTEWLGIDGTIIDESGATTDDGVNLTGLILSNSFLDPFMKRDLVAEAEKIDNTLDAIQQIEITPDSSTFTFFYLCYPHHPYYLDENGNMNPENKWINDGTGKNSDAYVGAVKYVNSKLLPAITRIVEEDPDAILVLCSDHGNRFGPITGKYTESILNTLYYGGEEITEFEGLSSINTMRMILNKEFGTNLEYIDLPGLS